MLGEELGDSGDLQPLSSLDLVDSFLNVDDHLDNYLKHLQAPLESSYQVQEQNLGLPYWPSTAPQPAFPQGDGSFPIGAPGTSPQGDLQPAAQLVTTGGDPGFLFQTGVVQDVQTKVQTESGSSTGRGVKRSASSIPGDSSKKIENTTLQKNRLAQRRFRERQKAKVKNLHTEIEELKAKVDALQLQNTALSSQNSILEKVLSMRDEQISSLQEEKDVLGLEMEESDQGSTVDRRSPLLLSCLKGRQMVLSYETIKSMTGGQLVQIWQAYVSEISDALVHVNGDNGESLQRIEGLISELCSICMRMSEANPAATTVLHAHGKVTTEVEEVKSWQKTLESLVLTDDQKREIVELRGMFLPKVQRLMKERGKLNLSSSPVLPSEVVGHRISLEYLKTHQMVARLKDILRKEHKEMVEFATTVVKKVLTPVQIAKLVVQSYPVKPDLLAIASAIAMEQGEDLTTAGNTQCLEGSPRGLATDGQGALSPFMFNSTCGSEVVSDNVLTTLEFTSRHTQR